MSAMVRGGATKPTGAALAGAAGASAVMKSDRRLKTGIRDGGRDIDDMLDRLAAKTYRYKNEAHGKGERPGIMAQDMAKSRMGKSTVVDLPDAPGRMGIDVNRALAAALASAARLNERMRKAGI